MITSKQSFDHKKNDSGLDWDTKKILIAKKSSTITKTISQFFFKLSQKDKLCDFNYKNMYHENNSHAKYRTKSYASGFPWQKFVKCGSLFFNYHILSYVYHAFK